MEKYYLVRINFDEDFLNYLQALDYNNYPYNLRPIDRIKYLIAMSKYDDNYRNSEFDKILYNWRDAQNNTHSEEKPIICTEDEQGYLNDIITGTKFTQKLNDEGYFFSKQTQINKYELLSLLKEMVIYNKEDGYKESINNLKEIINKLHKEYEECSNTIDNDIKYYIFRCKNK